KKPVCPMTRSLHPPMAHCGQRVRFAAIWREEFFEVPISESRKSRRNSVHYPVNAGYNVAHTACPATIDARRAVLPVQGTQDDDRRASSKARIANLRRDSARRS